MSLTFNLLRCEFIRLQYKKIRHMVYVREYMYIAYTDLFFFGGGKYTIKGQL